ncbi:MAG: hypothetical protein VR64_03565 [Desulfatitalea sp. BRH_c12]|jgi:hypothetical protein|nr:MAG: hypothetical protein VR64_03565 [Desulfatitalea sp. BRH_c12]
MTDNQNTPRKRRWRRTGQQQCHCCGQFLTFCWRCRCGFEICQSCMQANVWGMSCNHITWQCPDCGDMNGFGNQ